MGIKGVTPEDLEPSVSGPLVPRGIYLNMKPLTPVMTKLIDVITFVFDAYRALSQFTEDKKLVREARKRAHVYFKMQEQ